MADTRANGKPVNQIRIHKSYIAGEHVAAGNFEFAMCLLNRQLGIRNFSPLKQLFIDLQSGSHSYLYAFSSAPVMTVAVENDSRSCSGNPKQGLPALVYNFSQLEEKLNAGYVATSAGKFSEALKLFLSILHTIPLIVVETRREVDQVKELIVTVKEYVLGLRMELKRRELKDDPIRQQELAAYFTYCNLRTDHTRLAVLNAMTIFFKGGDFKAAATFARRFLETNPTTLEDHQAKKARQVLKAAKMERNTGDVSQLNYDCNEPFVVCGATYVPIYGGQKDITCPYCSTHFVPSGNCVPFVILLLLELMHLGFFVHLHKLLDHLASIVEKRDSSNAAEPSV